jgi:glycine/D-amino acid oxidase-like deaminating enzyme
LQANPIWPVETRFPTLSGAISKDVIVVGGGMAGISCAYHLRSAGFDIAVLERDQVGGPATGASSGVLYYGSGLNYIPSVDFFGKEKADLMWNETASVIRQITDLAERYNIDCGLRKCGAIMVARSDAEIAEIEKEHEGMAALGLPTRLLSREDLKAIYPKVEFARGISYDAVGQIHPARFAAGLARATGLEIYEETPAEEWHEDGERVIVKTPGGTATCSNLVLATNTEPCLSLEESCDVESSVILASVPTNSVKEVFPSEKIIWTMDEKYDIIYPRGDRLILELYALGDENERIAYYFPGVDFKIDKNYGEVWTKPRDWVPIFGKAKGRIYVAIGMGDQGIVMSWLSGSKMPGLLRNKEDWFTELAGPGRFLERDHGMEAGQTR